MSDHLDRLHQINGHRIKAGVLPVACQGLNYSRGGRSLLKDVSLSLEGVAPVAILGANGAGKTLLMRLLANLIAPDAGQVTWAGANPNKRHAARLGFVFQKPMLLRRSVAANVDYVLRVAGFDAATRRARRAETLAWASLQHLANVPARKLSSGEQQRLAIARVVATAPEIIFFDEPTANLDLASTAIIEEIIKEIAARGTKVVVVTHDIAQARRLAAEVLFMHEGRLVERSPGAKFFDEPQSEAAKDYLAGRMPHITFHQSTKKQPESNPESKTKEQAP